MNAQITRLETVFRALADATRLRILALLTGGEICVCHIHESLRIPQPKASRHLAYLRHAGLVEARKEGLWVHYRLAQPADAVIRTVVDAALHTLGHLETTRKDGERLQKQTGCCLPVASDPSRPCCQPQSASATRG